MIDEEARELDRQAREGDPAAKAALERVRARTGVPVCDYRHPDRAERACRHLLERPEQDFKRRFTGVSTRFELVCSSCEKGTSDLVETCLGCLASAQAAGTDAGFFGEPGVLERPSSLFFEHESLDLGAFFGKRVLAIAPVPASESTWLAYTDDHRLHAFDAKNRRALSSVPVTPAEGFSHEQPVWLHSSRRSDYTIVANRRGQRAAVVETVSGRRTMVLDRGEYHPEVSDLPAAFFRDEDRDLLVHGTDWNRLDISDPATGVLLTERSGTSYAQGELRPPHYLDYFHGGLRVSPDDTWMVDNGWVWHPFGVVASWSLRDWRLANPFESEDGSSKKDLCGRGYFWDGPLCWIGTRRVAVWGYGDDDENLIPAALIYDVESGRQVTWFAGPRGAFFFDRYLVSADPGTGTTVWDVETGERLLAVAGFAPQVHHPGARMFATLAGPELRLSTLRGSA